MQSFSLFGAAASFFGGWCGSVPMSVIIWYILHHHNPPPPGPDPWWRIAIIGALSGLAFGSLISAAELSSGALNSSVLVSLASGFIGGVVGASFAAKGALSSLK